MEDNSNNYDYSIEILSLPIYQNTYNISNVLDNFVSPNTFGQILFEMQDIFDNDPFEQMFRRRDPLEIAINESLRTYKHEEKKPIVLEITKQKFKNTQKKVEACSICQDDFKDTDEVSILDCEHYFHENCISEWGKYKPECPNCQKTIKYFMKKN